MKNICWRTVLTVMLYFHSVYAKQLFVLNVYFFVVAWRLRRNQWDASISAKNANVILLTRRP